MTINAKESHVDQLRNKHHSVEKMKCIPNSGEGNVFQKFRRKQVVINVGQDLCENVQWDCREDGGR